MNDCYIVCAADMAPARFTPGEGDYIIAADAGCRHLERLGARPDLIVGDFDSLGRIPSFPNVEVCPVEKDDTDSMIALRHAVTLGCRRILLFGALGGRRLDHTLANIQALAWARAQGAECFIIGEGCASPPSRTGTRCASTIATAATFPPSATGRTPPASASAGSITAWIGPS